MTYNDDLTWDDLSLKAGGTARQQLDSTEAGLRQYNEWQSFRAGRTNLQIATALSKTESEIADMDAVFGGAKEMHDAANNVAVATGDRAFAWRKFS